MSVKKGARPPGRRVAYLTNQLLDWETRKPRYGGGERYCLTLGTLLRDMGFEVDFYQAGYETFEGEFFGFPVRTIPIGEHYSEFQVGVCDAFFETSRDYDHVIYNVPAYAAGRMRDDAVMICHGIWFDHNNWPLPISFRTSEWFEHLYRAFSGPGRVVSVDANSINVIRALWPQLASKMRYLPNWVDTKVFQPPKSPRKGRPTVLIPRRSEVNRGSRLIGPVLELVPHDCRVVWVGEGEDRESEEIRAVAGKDPRLEFHAASFDQMPRYYQEADICLIPTVAAEGTSLACLEALASGCAVIATNVGGLPEIVQPGVNGLLVDPEPGRIAAAINLLLTSKDERVRLQAAGPASAQNFRIEIWQQRWRELIEEVGWMAAKTSRQKTPAATEGERTGALGEGIRRGEIAGALHDGSSSDSASNARLAQRLAKQETDLSYLKEAASRWDRSFQDSIDFLKKELAGRNQILEDRDKSIDFLQKQLLAMTGTIGERDKAIFFLEANGRERERALASLQQQISALEQSVASHKSAIADQGKRLEYQEQTLAERDKAISFLQISLEGRDKIIAELQQEVSTQAHTIETQGSEIEEQKRHLRHSEVEVDLLRRQKDHLERDAQSSAEGIAWLRQEMAEREQKLQDIYHSRLWRSAEVYWNSRRAVGNVTNPIQRGVKSTALSLGRLVLPNQVKRYLKRFWDPNETISPKEAALLLEQQTSERSAMVEVLEAHPKGQAVPLPINYDIICFSIIDWEFRWQRPQQIMSRLADEGHRVFFLSTTQFLPPGGEPYQARKLRENVWEVALASLRPIDVYGGELPEDVTDFLEGDFRALRDEFNITCGLSVIQVATWSPVAARLRTLFGWHVVYDCMDEWNTFPGMKDEMLRKERELVRDADLVVVSAQRLLEKWGDQNQKGNVVLARNAADYEHYANTLPNDLLEKTPRPIVGYFGAIAEWFDLDLMLELARQRPQYSFVLLGGVFDVPVAELEKLPNVQVLGQKPYALMPAYLVNFDACIIPFKVNAVTEATDPVKFYEYISLGKPVVAPRMPELYPYREYLYIADDTEDFIRKVDQALSEKDSSLVERRVALARENTWQARVGVIKEGVARGHGRVSIIVVTYHNLDYTKLCLDSILRNTPWPNYEVIIVDNASNDGTPEFLRQFEREHENVTVILNDRNEGFARANNQGLEIATGDYLILLNNDTVVPNGWVPKLLRHLDEPEIGLAVTVTNFSGNESRIEVPYTDLSEMEGFAARYTREHEGQVFDIRVAAMYCVAMRREVFAKVGPLDDQFSVGMFEDDDYSHRMRLAGFRVVCVEDTFVHHFGQASFKKLSAGEYQAIWDRNQKLYEKKWSTEWTPHTPRRRVKG